jgi:hypothetical protein
MSWNISIESRDDVLGRIASSQTTVRPLYRNTGLVIDDKPISGSFAKLTTAELELLRVHPNLERVK